MTMTLPSTKRFIGQPEGGWKENTLYHVHVAFRPSNPIHSAILFTGYLNGQNGEPGAYHALFNPSWDSNATLSDIHFLGVIGPLDEKDQIFRKE